MFQLEGEGGSYMLYEVLFICCVCVLTTDTGMGQQVQEDHYSYKTKIITLINKILYCHIIKLKLCMKYIYIYTCKQDYLQVINFKAS